MSNSESDTNNITEYSIYLIRHAKPSCMPCIYGRTDVDIFTPNTDDFKNFAAGRNLENFRICSSPLTRCRKTAEIFRQVIGSGNEIEIISDLQEIYLGELDGLPFGDYTKRQKKSLKTAMTRPAYAKIKGAEPISKLRHRACRVLEDLINRRQNVIAVTHCGVIKMIFSFLMGVNMKSNRLWLDWDLNYLSGIVINCQYSLRDGVLKKNFAVLEPISVSYAQTE